MLAFGVWGIGVWLLFIGEPTHHFVGIENSSVILVVVGPTIDWTQFLRAPLRGSDAQ